MALLVNEDCPHNPAELHSLLGDFLSDGLAYSEDEGLKLCNVLYKHLIDQSLLNVAQRDTIIAEKLSAPIMISELAQEGHSGVVREDDFYDPLLAGEKPQEGGNYNPTEEGRRNMDKRQRRAAEKAQAEKDALDKKIDEFMATKEKVPPPRVMHDKSGLTRADIYLPSVSVIAGGKHLLEKAVVKLVRGRKYGLVGRNGIGKTTLINAMCRKELEKMPRNLHILQVE